MGNSNNKLYKDVNINEFDECCNSPKKEDYQKCKKKENININNSNKKINKSISEINSNIF